MKRTRRQLRPVAVSQGPADVYLDGVIGEDVLAADIREQLALANGAPVNVHINSEGGSVTEGMAIYAALRGYAGRKVGIVEGIAASMASVCLMACDDRRVAKGAFVMIHNPSGGAKGEATDLRHAADLLDKMRSEMLDIYESRTGLPRADLEKMTAEETWLTAEEAVASGLADAVTGDDATIKLDAVARLDRDSKNIPEALRALAQKESTMTAEEEKEMRAKMKALEEENAQLKAEAEEDEEKKDDESAEDGDDDGEEEEESASDDDEKKEARALARDVLKLTGAKTFAEARGSFMAIAHKAGAAGRDSRATAVSDLIAKGQLLPAQKSWALKLSPKAFDGYVKAIGGTKVAPVAKAHKEPTDPKLPAAEPTEAERKIAAMFGISDDAKIIEARSAKVRIGLVDHSKEN